MKARSFFSGLWRALNGLRKVLHLIMLLAIFGLVIGLLRGSIPLVPAKAALLVAPEGPLVEQLCRRPACAALDEALGNERAQALLWDLTESIRAAAADKRIQVLALDLDKLERRPSRRLAELAAAIREFRATGKKVIAYGVELSQERYYLAAQADEIYLDPMGFVLVQGYDRYRIYLKDALDKLGVDINVFRVGAFKSAIETFTRNNMSPRTARRAAHISRRCGTAYQAEVTTARKIAAGCAGEVRRHLHADGTGRPGRRGQGGPERGPGHRPEEQLEVEQRLTELVGKNDEGDSFSGVASDDYLRVAKAEKRLNISKQKVGVIVASGEILDGDQPPGTIGGDSTARLIREARFDKEVKALVLRVDSPGGSVLASEQIYRELLALRAAGKPLVVSMGGYAASGGYYISVPADEIWASPATITGSIGIFAIIPTFDKTLGKLGVSVDGVGTTALSGQARIDRPLSEGARAVLQRSPRMATTNSWRASPAARQENDRASQQHRAGARVGRNWTRGVSGSSTSSAPSTTR